MNSFSLRRDGMFLLYFQWLSCPASLANEMPLCSDMCTCTTAVQSEANWSLGSLLAARRGDGDAFTSLVSPHAPRLQRLARRLTRSHEDAEDVCQESLLKAFTKLDQFDGARMERDAFCAWLMRITANCAIDYLRRKKANRLIPLEECPLAVEPRTPGTDGWGESPEAHCTRQEQLRIVAEIMADLPAELRSVCLLRNMMELSTKEVAARLGISSNAVRLRLFRAHHRLRAIMSRRHGHGRKRHGHEVDCATN